MKRIFTVLFFFLFLPTFLLAGTAGRIKGKVTDLQTGEALIGANVIVVGTTFGAATDVNGDYVIQNIDAGTYTIKASFIGYQTVTISNVRVNADLSTDLTFKLPAEGVNVKEVEVIAQRPLVQKDQTNANRITTSEDIDALPVRGINNILALTPGVTLQDKTIFIRGGRQDEVGYYLEGANISDPVVGGRSVTLVQDAIEEIQVQSGGYTAEFGNANAGIIRQQIKSGTSEFKASAEYVTDNVGFSGKSKAFSGDKRLGTNWFGYNEAIATLSGPLFTNSVKFFGLFNYNFQRDQTPQNYPGINIGIVGDPGGDTVNLTYPAGALMKNSLEQYTGTGTLTFDFNPIIFRLVGTFTSATSFNPFSAARVAGNIANMFNQNRTEQVDQRNGAFTLKATHLVSPSTFYEISGGYSFNTTNRYDPLLKDNYVGYGDSVANADAGGTWYRRPEDPEGDGNRFERPERYNVKGFTFNGENDVVASYLKNRRSDLTINGSLTSTMSSHQLKVGGELQMFTIRNYSFGNEGVMALAGLFNTATSDTAREAILINRGVNNYGFDVFGNESDATSGPDAAKRPIFAAFYVQDKIEFKDLILNLGLRFDYIDVDNQMFVDPARPDLAINKNTGALIPEGWKDVPTFNSLSPRLGFSFPVTDLTVFHAQYGKFVQQTRLRDIYQGQYATSANLKGGFEITAPVGFNVRPTRTTQYEIGFTQQIGEFASFDITGFYKDIQDQVVYQKQKTQSQFGIKDYAILTNGDFATTKGLEISFNMRRQARFQVNGGITFQDAQGTGSFPNSNRGIVGAPLDGVTVFTPQYISPLEFNNSFRGNLNLDYRFGVDDGPSFLHQFGISALMTFTSGHPFTRGIGGVDLEGDARDRQPIEALNSSTTPWTFQVDLRVDKSFNIIDKLSANIYLYVINLFDTKNIQNVFLRTGSTTDDGVLSDPSQGGKQIETYGAQYAQLYRAIYIDYYEQWQFATTGAPYTTAPLFYGPPRQIRLGVRFEY